MKNLLLLLALLCHPLIIFCQIPIPGNVLWLRADLGVYSDLSNTPANNGDLVQVWEDRSGNGNHFVQDLAMRRPTLRRQGNVLCSQPIIRFEIERMTYLYSHMRLSGPKSIFIVFVSPSLVGNPETLLSIKNNAGTSFTEILCSDNAAYQPLSFMSEMPSSPTGGTLANSVGNNVTFSSSGNLFSMTYNGGPISSPGSYSSHYDGGIMPVVGSGNFGRLPNDSSTIGARAPQQNWCFLSGDIAEIIVYNRVLTSPEIDSVENYLITKYGFLGSCVLLPLQLNRFEANYKFKKVHLDWEMECLESFAPFKVEQSRDARNWQIIGEVPTSSRVNNYYFAHQNPQKGANYYRITCRNAQGIQKSGIVRKVEVPDSDIIPYDFYPNPAGSTLTLQGIDNEKVNFTITDNKGRIIVQKKIICNRSIQLPVMSPGLYYIRIEGKHGSWIKKLLKV